MKNKVSEGIVLTVTAPKEISSGELFFLGDLALVASTSAKEGEVLGAHTRGHFIVPKAKVETSAGLEAYFDGKEVTVKQKEGEPLKKIGFFLRAEESESPFTEILLSQ